MALLRFDPKKDPYFIEAGWPRKGSAEKNGIRLRLVKRGSNGEIVLVRDLLHLTFEKTRLKEGIHSVVPELGDVSLQYRKALGLFPLITLTLNGEVLRGHEVLSSIFGEIW